jgi:exodeoxyribonuclease-3
MKIATWNVNSLRVRLEHVLAWLKMASPDVLALQEIKMVDEVFPVEAFQALGYHSVFSGQATYNGVAILSKEIPQVLARDFPDYVDPQRRLLAVKIRDLFILNIYVPNGSEVGSEKYQYKLAWLDHLEQFLRKMLQEHPKLVVLGDFNIAPSDEDVHDPVAWQGSILVSPSEREAFNRLIQLGFEDSFLRMPVARRFTWWDYRMGAFKRNHGARIDHIMISGVLVNDLKGFEIDTQPRAWERPSDHTPVMIKLDY